MMLQQLRQVWSRMRTRTQTSFEKVLLKFSQVFSSEGRKLFYISIKLFDVLCLLKRIAAVEQDKGEAAYGENRSREWVVIMLIPEFWWYKLTLSLGRPGAKNELALSAIIFCSDGWCFMCFTIAVGEKLAGLAGLPRLILVRQTLQIANCGAPISISKKSHTGFVRRDI